MSRSNQSAEILGLEALAWLARDNDVLERFMNACGTDAVSLRAAADQPETAVAVLDFLLADEALLLAFCESASCDPMAVHRARHQLDGAGDDTA